MLNGELVPEVKGHAKSIVARPHVCRCGGDANRDSGALCTKRNKRGRDRDMEKRELDTRRHAHKDTHW